MPESSPWYHLYQFAPPHFPYCGTIHDGWIIDPVDTFTSFFYSVVAFIIYQQAKNGPKELKNIAWIPLVVTVGSILFHASFTYTFLVADFLGIFYLNFYGINLNFTRLGKLDKSKIASNALWTTLGYGVLMALMYKLKIHSGLLMIPILGIFIWSEWRCSKIEPDMKYKYYFLAVLLSALGYACMLIEGPPLRIGCLPGPLEGKVQLHTIWHLLSAASMVCIFKFYNQETVRKKLL